MMKLTTADKRKLLQQPETGMGYQIVNATTQDNKTREGIVFNAELFFEGGESRAILKTAASYSDVLKLASTPFWDFKEISVISRSEAPRTLSLRKEAFAKGGPAKTAPIEKTKANEVFKRFSAFANDNRVQSDGSWSEGTYATTEEDAKNVKTGKEAVARYALPNPDPASYVYTCRPKQDLEIQRGIVEPAFEQPGGGVEVIFPKGTNANSVTLPPEKIKDE